ncbi:MAG TPA: hypothetical protein VIJ23_19940 [Mycobacterium sp.]
MITDPPLDDGADHDTTAEAFPATPDTPVGAPGTVGALGVTAADAAEAGPVPIAFVADTVNVYAVPFVNPDTVADVAGGAPDTVVDACATPATYGVTEYDVIAEPPFDGADHDTTADPFPATADTPVGAPGTVTGAGVIWTVAATEGTPAALTMKSM